MECMTQGVCCCRHAIVQSLVLWPLSWDLTGSQCMLLSMVRTPADSLSAETLHSLHA